jgi:hypothetical protein
MPTGSPGDDNGFPIEVESAKAVSQGGNIVIPAYFVVHGYYTPAHPDGDSAVLAQAKVEIVMQGAGEVAGDGAYNDEQGSGVVLGP